MRSKQIHSPPFPIALIHIPPSAEVVGGKLKGYKLTDEMIQRAATFCAAIAQGEKVKTTDSYSGKFASY